jgi:hypothetical protein
VVILLLNTLGFGLFGEEPLFGPASTIICRSSLEDKKKCCNFGDASHFEAKHQHTHHSYISQRIRQTCQLDSGTAAAHIQGRSSGALSQGHRLFDSSSGARTSDS